MDIKSFFNIVLLGLSLTTIFITMISYIVFKLRQGSIISNNYEFQKLEGSYFRRYAPELEKINERKRAEMRKIERNPKKFYYKIISIFAFVFLIIITLLMADEYYQQRAQRFEALKSNVKAESVYDNQK